MNIAELVKKAHDNAVSKGFYECENCDNTGKVLEVCNYYTTCDVCNGSGKAHKNVGELLMLVVSELGEAVEAHRKGKTVDKSYIDGASALQIIGKTPDKEAFEYIFEDTIKDTFEDELADAVIRIADMCGYLNIDLEKHIELKMRYNATREYKHGKRY